MNRFAKPAAAGRPPPRLVFAVAAAAAAVAVHAAVFGLFDQHAQQHARLAAAAGERAYAACLSERDRARRRESSAPSAGGSTAPGSDGPERGARMRFDGHGSRTIEAPPSSRKRCSSTK